MRLEVEGHKDNEPAIVLSLRPSGKEVEVVATRGGETIILGWFDKNGFETMDMVSSHWGFVTAPNGRIKVTQ